MTNQTAPGVGILIGNLATGTLMEAARNAGAPELIWLALFLVGATAAFASYRLDRAGRLQPSAVALSS
jgi:hypothetical protein